MSSVTDILDEVADDAPAPSTSASTTADLLTADDSGPAKSSVRLSNGIAPDAAAKVLRLKNTTNLPTDFISRNADKVQTQVDNSTITPEFTEQHPGVTSYISEDPHHAAVVGQDIKSLGFVERQFKYMKNQAERGVLDTERSVRWALKGVGFASPDNDQRLEHIDKRLQTDLNMPAPGTVSGVFGQAVEAVPQLAGAVGAGALATMAKVPATPAIAAAFGTLEFGNAYADFASRKDEQGNPKMTDNEARGFALLSGVGNGLLFTLPVGRWVKKMPGLNMIGKDGLMSMIESPALFPVMKKFAAQVGEMGLTMGGFSGVGSLIHSASGRLAEMKSDGSLETASPMAILSRILPPEDLKAAVKSAGSGTVTGMVFGGIPGISGGVSDYRNYTGSMKAKELYYIQQHNQAVNNAQGWKNIGKVLEGTKIAEIAPEQVDNLMSRVAPQSDVFIPLEQWQDYWQKQKVDPRAAFLEVAGDIKGYDEALRTGTDIQLPASRYAAKIAPTEHNEFFSDHLRSEPLAMNADEAGKAFKIQAELEKEQSEATIKNEIVPPAPEEVAVQQAKDKQGMAPLFSDPEALGMKPEKAARYKQAIDQAHLDAKEEIVRKITDQEIRQKSASWLSERDSVESQVEKESWNHKEFVAKEILGKPIETKEASEAMAKTEHEVYRAKLAEYEAWREILKTGIKKSEDVAGELRQIPLWMKNESGRGYDEVVQEAREKGLLGPNEDIFVKLRNIKKPSKPLSAEEFVPEIVKQLKPIKLNSKFIEENHPDIDRRSLRGMTAEEGGLTPDEAATILGFNSGSELLYALKTTPKRSEWISEETDQRMMQRHPEARSMFGTAPDLMSDAMEMVHNEKRSQVLRLELEHLASNDFAAFKGLIKSIGRRIPSIKEVRADAEKMVGEKTTAQTLPSLYLRAESVASREAQEHFLRGDFEKAFESKQAELLNHELYRAAVNAKEQSAKDIAFARRAENDSFRQRIGKAGGSYLEQFDAIHDAFDFGPTTLKGLAKKQGLREWIQEQNEAGFNPIVPPDLLEAAGKKSWRELSNDELRDTVNSMRNIAHLASLKNKLLASVKERTYDETKMGIIENLTKRYDLTPEKLNKPYELHPSFVDKIKGDLNTFGAWRTRLEPLFNQTGLHETLFEPMNLAENFQNAELRKSRQSLNDIFSVYSKVEKARFGKVTYIPELEGSGLSPNMNKMEMIMTLLHGGNEGNMQQMLRGYKMTEGQLRGIWKRLEPRDVEIAQKIWDFIDSYWPQISKQERELNGLPPEKVEGRPLDVTLADGSKHHLEGGYFPLIYDRNVSFRTAALGEDADIKEMFASYAGNTATKHNWTKARIGGGDQAPSLKFSVLTNHVFDVIHDLAYRKPTIDNYKLINDPDIQQNMQAGFGKAVYKQLNPWLKRIAGTREWDPLGPLAILRKVQSNMTVAELGLKLTSALNDIASLPPAVRALGEDIGLTQGMDYLRRGFSEFSNAPAAFKFMFEKDESMRSRWEDAGNRDIRAAEGMFNLVNEKPGLISEMKAMSPLELKDMWLPMRLMDMAIGGPIWYGSYFKAMEGKVKGIDALDERAAVSYAARTVRDIKGSGAAKDMSPFQGSNNQALRMMSMFSSMLSVIDNQMMKGYRDFRADKNIGKLVGVVMMNWFLPAIFAELASGRGPQDEDSWEGWAAKTIGVAPLEYMPITREAVNFFERGKYEISPTEEAVATILKTARNLTVKNPIGDAITGDESEWTKKDFSDFVMSIGYTRGIPTRQLVQSSMRLNNWMSEEEPHDNPLTGMISVITGSKNTH